MNFQKIQKNLRQSLYVMVFLIISSHSSNALASLSLGTNITGGNLNNSFSLYGGIYHIKKQDFLHISYESYFDSFYNQKYGLGIGHVKIFKQNHSMLSEYLKTTLAAENFEFHQTYDLSEIYSRFGFSLTADYNYYFSFAGLKVTYIDAPDNAINGSFEYLHIPKLFIELRLGFAFSYFDIKAGR